MDFLYVTFEEGLNVMTDPNKIINVITFHPKCNKVLKM